ncbi:MAG: hypothetical protein AB1894_03850 [Chloroflexota bacterium]
MIDKILVGLFIAGVLLVWANLQTLWLRRRALASQKPLLLSSAADTWAWLGLLALMGNYLLLPPANLYRLEGGWPDLLVFLLPYGLSVLVCALLIYAWWKSRRYTVIGMGSPAFSQALAETLTRLQMPFETMAAGFRLSELNGEITIRPGLQGYLHIYAKGRAAQRALPKIASALGQAFEQTGLRLDPRDIPNYSTTLMLTLVVAAMIAVAYLDNAKESVLLSPCGLAGKLRGSACLAIYASPGSDKHAFFLDNDTLLRDSYVDVLIHPLETGGWLRHTVHLKHDAQVSQPSPSADRTRLATCVERTPAEIWVWDLPAKIVTHKITLGNRQCQYLQLSFAPDSHSLLLTYPLAGQVEVLDFAANQRQAFPAEAAVYLPDSRIAIVQRQGSKLSLAGLLDQELLGAYLLPIETYETRDVAISPDGRWLAAAYRETQRDDAGVLIWDALSGRLAYQEALPGDPACVPVFSPDSRWLAACAVLDRESTGSFIVLDLSDGRLVQQSQTGSARPFWPSAASFSPDGRRLAVSAEDYVMVFQVEGQP